MAPQVNYNEGVADVAPQANVPNDYLSSSAATPAAFGGQVAGGLEKLGEGASTSAKFFGKVAADDASNQFQDFATKLLHGDPNKTIPGPDGQAMPDTGYLGLRGRAALDARPQISQQMDDRLKELRGNLTSPEQQLEFDNFTRRYRSVVDERIGSHADGQATTWYSSVNTSTAKLAMDHISNNFDSPQEVAAGFSDLTSAYVKQAQLAGAKPGDPQFQEAIDSARRDGLQAQLNAMAVKDPARALAILDKNKDIAGVKYDDMAKSFRARADQQRGIDIGEQAIRSTYTVQPAPAVQAAKLTEIGSRYGVSGAFLQREQQLETGNNPNQTSSTGAKGPFQFIDSTAKRYGVKDPFDFEQAADGAARLAADNRDQLATRLGRAPTDVEVYLAHNQGAGGAAALLSNPTVRAGDLVGDYAIRVNGGDPNAPASAFTSMIANRWNTAPQADGASRKAAAYQTVLAIPDSDITPEARQHALTYVNQQIQAQQIAQDQGEKARKEAGEQAQSQLVSEIIRGAGPEVIQKIADNPVLTGPQKESLYNFITTKGGVEDPLSYGPGYTQTMNRVMAPADDPGKITSVEDVIRLRNDGQLTRKGAADIIQTMSVIKKQPDQAGISTTKAKQLEYYQNKFALSQSDLGGFVKPFKNQKGLDRFNHDFVPAFESAYSDWVAKGKDPMEFLSNNKMLDQMMNRIYPPDQRSRDTLQGGESAGKAPPAPDGIDPKNWDKLVNSPPKGSNTDGQPISPADWSKALLWLRDNPTEENKAKFDQKLKPSGYTADYVLKQLPPAPFVDTTGGPAVADVHATEPPPPPKPLLERIPQTMLPPSMRTNSEEEKNLRSADEELHLTPQEKFLYRMHLHNLNGSGGVDNPPDAENPQGSRSTLYQAVQEHNGKFYNIPTVWDGKREVEPYTKPDGTVIETPNKTALANVEKIGWDKFPSYATAEEADARYEKMHKFLERDTAEYLSKKKRGQEAEKENERLVEEGREGIR
jgi:soluble lytic murein transglycosylase-like protein